MKLSDIQMRDPFVLALPEQKRYFLYGTTDVNCWVGPFVGFDVYESTDLEEWAGPYPAFRPSADFWADQNFWAPEVFQYQGRFYMFASFKAENQRRGTQILVANDPKGPFLPHSDGPVTPRDWECLDGTLYVDPAGKPWMIFCHEWVQIANGEIHAMPLTTDLRAAAGSPHLLFKGSDAKWTSSTEREIDGVMRYDTYVTDGPFIYQTKSKQLLMLWSSRGHQGYAMGIAIAKNGNILGPWEQEEEPIYKQDGGHGMFFKTFTNKLMMTIHTPNKTPLERPVFIEVCEVEDRIVLA